MTSYLSHTFPDTVSPSRYNKCLSFLPSSVLMSAVFLVSLPSSRISISADWPKPKKLYKKKQFYHRKVTIVLLSVATYHVKGCLVSWHLNNCVNNRVEFRAIQKKGGGYTVMIQGIVYRRVKFLTSRTKNFFNLCSQFHYVFTFLSNHLRMQFLKF